MPDFQLSDSERYIMQFFWEHGDMKTDELGVLVAEKEWKPTTLLTFLSRLTAKGMLRVHKQGKSNLYSAVVGRNEYTRMESQLFINEMYGGSTKNFVAAMVGNQLISKDELKELRAWLAAQEDNDDD